MLLIPFAQRSNRNAKMNIKNSIIHVIIIATLFCDSYNIVNIGIRKRIDCYFRNDDQTQYIENLYRNYKQFVASHNLSLRKPHDLTDLFFQQISI